MSDRELTDLQKRFLDVLFDEAKGNHKRAMKLAGYSDNCRVADVVYPLKDEIKKRGQEYLAVNAPIALVNLIGVFDDPAAVGAKNSIAAAKEVLDRTGIVKQEQIEVKATTGGIFLLPPKQEAIEQDEDD